MKYKISFVVPVAGELDIERMELIQLYLFDLFKTNVPIYVLHKNNEKSLLEDVKKKCPKLDIRLVPESELATKTQSEMKSFIKE